MVLDQKFSQIVIDFIYMCFCTQVCHLDNSKLLFTYLQLHRIFKQSKILAVAARTWHDTVEEYTNETCGVHPFH